MKNTLGGAYAVLLTPFKDGQVDYEAFKAQVLRLQGSNIAGYMVNGSTAEFPTLSFEEQKKLVEIVYENKDKNKKIIVGACASNIKECYDRCVLAKQVGAEGVLVCPPFYFKYTKQEREAFYTKLADISPVPVILYNVPFFTQELELDVIYRLSKHPNIWGIKDSSANMKRLIHMVENVGGDDFKVLTGTDDILFPALVGGCVGSMTALATIYPDKIFNIYKYVGEGNLEMARKEQHSILPCLREADSETFPLGYKKLMEKASGIPFGNKGDEL